MPGFEGSDHLISRAYTLAKEEGHHVLIRGNHGVGFADVAVTTDGWLKVAIQSGDTENATVNIAGSVTLNSLVEIVASITLNAIVNTAAANLTVNLAGSVTLNSLVEVVGRSAIAALNTGLLTLEGDYDTTSTESQTSVAVDASPYRMATLSFTLTKTGSPGAFTITVLNANDGTNYMNNVNGGLGSWVYSQAAVGSGISRAFTFPVATASIKVTMDAAGLTNGVDEYNIANCDLYLRE